MQEEIKDLVEATRADEQRKAEIAELLRGIDEKLGKFESFHAEEAQRLAWIEKVVGSLYTNIYTLIELLGASMGEGKSELNRLRKEIEERAMREGKAGLTIKAGRDVEIEGDVSEGG